MASRRGKRLIGRWTSVTRKSAGARGSYSRTAKHLRIGRKVFTLRGRSKLSKNTSVMRKYTQRYS